MDRNFKGDDQKKGRGASRKNTVTTNAAGSNKQKRKDKNADKAKSDSGHRLKEWGKSIRSKFGKSERLGGKETYTDDGNASLQCESMDWENAVHTTQRLANWNPWDDLYLSNAKAHSSATPRQTKDDAASSSDSDLLAIELKANKKSWGDFRNMEGRKQVKWNDEVDVLYVSQLTLGDARGEIVGRSVEPLRNEAQQQRTGIYAKGVMPLQLRDQWVAIK